MVSPRMIIRADSSNALGVGHVMRMLALAQTWKDLGGVVTFVSKQLGRSIQSRLESEGMAIAELGRQVTLEQDLSGLLSVVSVDAIHTCVVVDGYDFTSGYLQRLAAVCRVTVFFDDCQHLDAYPVSIVVNQNLDASSVQYPLPERGQKYLLGLKYALLRREIRDQPKGEAGDRFSGLRLLVTLGGSDPLNLTPGVILALQKIGPTDMLVRVIVGAASSNLSEVNAVVNGDSRFRIIVDANDMGSQYQWATAAISAGGSTNWEMCYFGLPRAIFVVAENQTRIASKLCDLGVSYPLGNSGTQRLEESLGGFLRALSDSSKWRHRAQEAACRLVDGQGAERVCKEILLKLEDGPAVARALSQ